MRVHPPALGLLSLGLVALGLRGLRGWLRWDEVALAYAAYTEPLATLLAQGELRQALGTWVGLHPPLHGLLMGLIEVAWPAPAAWIGLSVVASTLAVVVVGRRAGLLAGLALAGGPMQLAYCGEVNNYPLAVLTLALVLAAGHGSWALVALSSVAAAWTHVLGAVAGGAAVAWELGSARLSRVARLRLAGAASLGVLPVVAGVWVQLGRSTTFAQPELDPSQWWETASQGVGIETGGLVVLGILGLRGRALALALALALAYALALGLGAAAPHQRPYLALMGLPLVWGLGHWRFGRGLRGMVAWLVLPLALVQLGRGTVATLGDAQVLAAAVEAPRGIDRALAEASPGDSLWLVAPALRPDDDKQATAPLLHHLSPWRAMPLARPVPFEYTDYRYGQPRRWGELTVHTSVELEEAVFDQVAAEVLGRGGQLWVVLYEHAPAGGLEARVDRVLRPYRQERWRVAWPEVPGVWGRPGLSGSEGLGADLVVRVEGLAEAPQ